MAQVIPYINFADQGREAIEFYKGVFGGEAEVTLVKDSGMVEQMPKEWGERIMHLDFKGDNGIRFFGSDLISDQAGLERGNGYQLAIACESDSQVKALYAKLMDGGTSVMEPGNSPWGGLFAQCTDQFGISWMLDSNS